MRADRLLSLLMFLQVRGRMTAKELAEKLEVSERTVYRDLEALNAAGVPVITERGPNGGCQLPGERYRTNLTGLTEPEVRGLFLSAVPGPLADLGLGSAVEAAMLKLAAALPTVHRRDVERLRQRIHVDAAHWFRRPESLPHLPTLQEAVWQDRRLHITYTRGDGNHVERTVEPYGLVAKANIWYLVGCVGGQMRVYRVSRIGTLDLEDEHFERPETFDLQAYWAEYCAEFEADLPKYPVKLRVAPQLVPILPQIYGEGIRSLLAEAEPPDAVGWTTLTLTFESLESARTSVMGLGAWAEILEPEELRDGVLEMALNIVEMYRPQVGAVLEAG